MNYLFKISCLGLLVLLGASFIFSCSNPMQSSTADVIPVYTYKVVNVYPHDRNALFFILRAEPNLNNRSKFRGPPQLTGQGIRPPSATSN